MADIHETTVIPRDLLHEVLRRSWTLNLPSVSVFQCDDQSLKHEGPGRVAQDPSTGYLWLEITAHAPGFAERINEVNACKAGSVIGPQRLLNMVGVDASGMEWRSEMFMENGCDGGFHGGLATYRFRLDSIWKGPRSPSESIRECIVLFDGHLLTPMAHASHINIADGGNGDASSHSIRNRLHFGSCNWTRQVIHRLGGYTECLLSRRRTAPDTETLPPFVEEMVTQSLTVSFKILCDWVVCYYSTAAHQTLVVRSLPISKPWASQFPIVSTHSVRIGTASQMLSSWFDSLLSGALTSGWDMRARVIYSILKNEQALAEVPTQLLVIGAGIETIARKYSLASGFDLKPALEQMSRFVEAVRKKSIDGVTPEFAERLNGFKQMMSGFSAKELFRMSNPGTHLDFTDPEIKSWGEGRNLPAHGKWPEADFGVPYLYSMITMIHKALLRTVNYRSYLTDYSVEGWPLIPPNPDPVMA